MSRKTRRTARFSHDWLDAMTPPSERREWYDTEVNCLVVRIGKTGSKVFYWFGRLHGQMSRMKLGVYPQMPVAAARREAKRITGEAASGLMPKPRAIQARDELTLDDLFQWYMRTHAKPHKSTWKEDESRYKARLAQWGHRKLSAITTLMVQDHHVAIGADADGGPYAANKMLELLGTMYRKGKKPLNITTDDPTSGIKRFPATERERFLNHDELPKFLAAVQKLPRAETRDCILLSLFTGARRSNVCAMKWADIDMKNGTWNVAAGESKKRKSMLLVLPSVAMEILSRRKKSSTGQYVLPGQGKTGHIVEPKHAMAAAIKEAGIAHVRFHDLRRTLGSWQAAQGTSETIIGKSLGHSSTRSTRVYTRLQLAPVRDAVERATAAMKAVSKKSGK